MIECCFHSRNTKKNCRCSGILSREKFTLDDSEIILEGGLIGRRQFGFPPLARLSFDFITGIKFVFSHEISSSSIRVNP